MSDDAILLKIKREFEREEAVQVLLKKISELEIEIGMLHSDISEKEDEIVKKDAEIHQLRHKEIDSKRGWLRDEVIAEINREMLIYKNLHSEREKKYKEMELKYSKVLIELQNFKNKT